MPMTGKQSVENFALDLDGMNVGFVKSVAGGTASADVVVEKLGTDGIAHKHIGGVKYEDITLTCGAGMSKNFFDWLTDTFDRKPSFKDGAIVSADANPVERERLGFYHGLLSEIGFPGGLDAASKDAALLTVKISPEYTRRVAGQKGRLTPPELNAQKGWLRSNFRLHRRAGLHQGRQDRRHHAATGPDGVFGRRCPRPPDGARVPRRAEPGCHVARLVCRELPEMA